MIGLIVKGATSLFLEGPDPAAAGAVAVINRYKGMNLRSWESKLSQLNLKHVTRPRPLSRDGLGWAYVFVALTEGDERRLEPGPFDAELTSIVAAIEAEDPPTLLPS